MSIFFVLSGFVIHYTYGQSLRRPHGLYNFFVARFARLYPLYFILIAAELLYSIFIFRISPFGYKISTLPYYLTMTQTWWYGVFNDASLVYQFGRIAQISWSISTEAWFYLVYPVLFLGLIRLRRPSWTAATYIAHCLIATSIIGLVIARYDDIAEFALRAFGEMADGRWSGNRQDTFFRWVIYFSPYSRVFEFIAGCLSAQFFMTLSNKPVGPTEQTIGRLISALALFGLGFTQLFLVAPELFPFAIPESVMFFHMSFGYAPVCGVLIFCCARYKNIFTAIFSWRPVTILGDASYSIYLLHIVFFQSFRTQPVEATAVNILSRIGLFCGVSALVFAASLFSYRVIEVPARRWIRKRFSIDGQPMQMRRRLQRSMGVIGAFAAIILAVLFVRESRSAYARWVIVSKATTEEPAEGTINIVDGIYGASCVKIEKSNARESLRRNCNGRASCDYVVNVTILGDPAPGCSKDFKAEWRCSAHGEVRTLILPPEAGLKSVARLSCPPPGSR